MGRPTTAIAMGILSAALACSAISGAARASSRAVALRDWHDVKCRRYKQAWSSILGRMGTQGLSPDFIARHQAFLASNCTGRSDVCPRSKQEFELANIMVEASMNFGTASTFAPFACR